MYLSDEDIRYHEVTVNVLGVERTIGVILWLLGRDVVKATTNELVQISTSIDKDVQFELYETYTPCANDGCQVTMSSYVGGKTVEFSIQTREKTISRGTPLAIAVGRTFIDYDPTANTNDNSEECDIYFKELTANVDGNEYSTDIILWYLGRDLVKPTSNELVQIATNVDKEDYFDLYDTYRPCSNTGCQVTISSFSGNKTIEFSIQSKLRVIPRGTPLAIVTRRTPLNCTLMS